LILGFICEAFYRKPAMTSINSTPTLDILLRRNKAYGMQLQSISEEFIEGRWINAAARLHLCGVMSQPKIKMRWICFHDTLVAT
jgi:hypothetical protein